LWKIAKKHYGTARLQAVEFLVKANNDHIKSKDFVVEGQTLVIPELPADMFEPVRSVDVANQDSLAKVEELLSRPDTVVDAAHSRDADTLIGRSAPADFIPVGVPASQQPTSTEVVDASGIGSPRTYTVQPNDTYTKIAEKFLGSKRYWKEIQKLNPKIEPTKMMPGTKIVLPEKHTISTSSEMERTSA
jgi:nucleoid-associated protein YgaU